MFPPTPTPFIQPETIQQANDNFLDSLWSIVHATWDIIPDDIKFAGALLTVILGAYIGFVNFLRRKLL
jgi:hypothetical protein